MLLLGTNWGRHPVRLKSIVDVLQAESSVSQALLLLLLLLKLLLLLFVLGPLALLYFLDLLRDSLLPHLNRSLLVLVVQSFCFLFRQVCYNSPEVALVFH